MVGTVLRNKELLFICRCLARDNPNFGVYVHDDGTELTWLHHKWVCGEDQVRPGVVRPGVVRPSVVGPGVVWPELHPKVRNHGEGPY